MENPIGGGGGVAAGNEMAHREINLNCCDARCIGEREKKNVADGNKFKVVD